MTQSQRVLEYLKSHEKGITPKEAWSEFGLYRLADTIHKLRKRGHEIETVDEDSVNKFGEKVSYARYILIKEAAA